MALFFSGVPIRLAIFYHIIAREGVLVVDFLIYFGPQQRKPVCTSRTTAPASFFGM